MSTVHLQDARVMYANYPADCSQNHLRRFIRRLVQLLVQARMGNFMEASSCISDPEESDIFGMKIHELGEVTAYLRTALMGYPLNGKSITIEFQLHNIDGQNLPVEYWTFSVDESKSKLNTYGYFQLSNLLKTAASVVRLTPLTRHFSKKQGVDTFVILYKVIQGVTPVDLGHRPKTARLGSFYSSVGEITLSMCYRTEIVFPPLSVENEYRRCNLKTSRAIHTSSGSTISDDSSRSSPPNSVVIEAETRSFRENGDNASFLSFSSSSNEELDQHTHVGEFLNMCKASPPNLSFPDETLGSLLSQLTMLSSYRTQFSDFVQSITDLPP